MQASNAPSKSAIPFAESGTKNTIPEASQIGVTPGAASFTDGFPPLTMTPLVAGGVPPYGADFNGILNFLSAAARWTQAGGTYEHDGGFAAAIGGYPAGAVVRNSSGSGFWVSAADNNLTDPDAGGAGWESLLAGAMSQYGSRGLRAQNNASTPNTQFDIAADMVALRDPSTGATKVFSPVAGVTTNLLTAGPAANGRDQAAAFPASSWIHFYLISNGSTVASISSLTAPPTGPVMPAGYTMWAYVGAVRFGSGSVLSAVWVCGNTVFYRVPMAVLTGTATTSTPFSTSTWVPPNALEWAPMVENLALSASGAGSYAMTLFIDSYQAGLSGTGSASAVYSVSGGLAWLPNNSQAAQYRLNLMAGSGPTTTISVYGYRLANGG